MTPNPPETLRIKYARDYVKLMEEFWIAYGQQVVCDSLLKLIEDILEHCEGHYTVWAYRRHVIKTLEMDLKAELEWARAFSSVNPKNYQVWHHRSCLLLALEKPVDELDLLLADFLQEPKNYHAWQYRQWILQRFGSGDNVEEELRFVDEMIRIDVYNNSAWNHRVFVYRVLAQGSTERIIKELEYAKGKLELDPTNEAPKQYLKWLNSLQKQ